MNLTVKVVKKMNEEIIPVIKKDTSFQFEEDTAAEVVNMMPEEAIKSRALKALSTMPDNNVNSFIGEGFVIKLSKVDDSGKKMSGQFISKADDSFVDAKPETEIHPERVKKMEISQKEYTDQRIESLEKSFNQRLDSNEKLISEKLDNLHTKIELSLTQKIDSLKTEISSDRKESKRFTTNTALATGGIAVAIIIGVLGFVI